MNWAREKLYQILCPQVLTAITAWCNHNSALHTFEELFSAVRLEHMQQYELHVISQHVMADHTFVQERLAAALATAADPEPARTPNAEQRKQRCAAPTIYLLACLDSI